MNPRRSFYRKLTYLALMVGLLLPMAYISRPGSGGLDGRSPGGKLAQLRAEHKLSQANLGEIDPASETIKLATLGMRGVAANLLWDRANYYQKTKNWAALDNTLRQIIHLQPNFVSVWIFQGWNLSYNVSAEWDDFRDRYRWVVEGIEFLLDGTRYNENNTRLISDIGRFTGHKIGRSDERRQYRRLFRADDDFPGHVNRTLEERDNWLVGREWYLEAERAVELHGAPIKGGSQLMFYINAPLWRINYAEDLEVDGASDGRAVFGDNARRAWQGALRDWQEYGRRDILATTGEVVRLDRLQSLRKEMRKLDDQLVALAGDVRVQVGEKKFGALSAEDKEFLERNRAKPDPANQDEVNRIITGIYVPWSEVAEHLEGEKGQRAAELAAKLEEVIAIYGRTDSYVNQINYDYWLLRCTFESELETVRARQHVYEGTLAHLIDADMPLARDRYEQGFAEWRTITDKYPELLDDTQWVEEMIGAIQQYRQVLVNGLGTDFPEEFVLQNVLDAAAKQQQQAEMMERLKSGDLMEQMGQPGIAQPQE